MKLGIYVPFGAHLSDLLDITRTWAIGQPIQKVQRGLLGTVISRRRAAAECHGNHRHQYSKTQSHGARAPFNSRLDNDRARMPLRTRFISPGQG